MANAPRILIVTSRYYAHIAAELEASVVEGLGKRYGAARLEVACQRAIAHDSAQYRTVKTILSTGADMLPMSEPVTPPAYARSRFARSAASLFGQADLHDADPTNLH